MIIVCVFNIFLILVKSIFVITVVTAQFVLLYIEIKYWPVFVKLVCVCAGVATHQEFMNISSGLNWSGSLLLILINSWMNELKTKIYIYIYPNELKRQHQTMSVFLLNIYF